VIIGGIIRDTETKTVNKIPILGDLPLVGGLFRSTDKAKNKTELMVFLTPRIVRNPGQAATVTEEQKKQLRVPIPPSPGPVPDGPSTLPSTPEAPASGAGEGSGPEG
jgi:general secretion pathway protein D